MKNVKAVLVNLYGGIVKTTIVASAFLKAYDDKIIILPVFARLMGSESEKSKEMLKDSETKLSPLLRRQSTKLSWRSINDGHL